MSPFVDVVDRLAVRIRALPPRSQTALFLAAATVLAEAWREAHRAADYAPDDDVVVSSALKAAADFACGRSDLASPTLLLTIERAVFAEPEQVTGLTVVQDFWICLDTAVRGPSEGYDMASSTWYLLEPQFQAVSERLFGVSDVGGWVKGIEESTALADPALRQAAAAIEASASRLASNCVDDVLLTQLRTTLLAIRP